jgi:hypothetical protein
MCNRALERSGRHAAAVSSRDNDDRADCVLVCATEELLDSKCTHGGLA